MDKEIFFEKYELKGADYHYRQINKKNRRVFNSYVYARYKIELLLISYYLKKLSKDNQKVRILDVGCGDGVIFYLINNTIKLRNYELYGIDFEEKALNIARNKVPNGVFKNADVRNIPFEDNYFNIIISADVIEHISNPNLMLSEIKRVGKDQSYVIIGTPIRFTEIPFDKMHCKEFFLNEYKELLNSYFKIIKIFQSHKLVYFLLYEKSFKIFNRKGYFNLID